jgi:hypothetical protein
VVLKAERLLQSKRKPGRDPKRILFSILLVRAGDQKEKGAKTVIKVVVVDIEFLSPHKVQGHQSSYF